MKEIQLEKYSNPYQITWQQFLLLSSMHQNSFLSQSFQGKQYQQMGLEMNLLSISQRARFFFRF